MNIPPLKTWLILLLLLPRLHGVPGKPGSDRPNVLWITGEDMSARWLACYGNTTIQTPNFDRLAREGFRYANCYAHTPVCAPARSGWITGIHPVSTGTIYMRSLNALPPSLVWYPDALRARGYFAGNATKTDYNTSNRKNNEAGFGGAENQGTVGHYENTWDSYEETWWNNPKRKPNQPFFQVINAAGAHESVLHREKNTNEGVDPAAMKLAAYHPDIPELRLDYARYTAAVMGADKALGRILEQLEKDGLAEDTIVIYNSDHGGVIGRSKRFLYDSGTQAAFIVRIPKKYQHLWPADQPGTRIDRLVSFLDMPKTWLAITGSSIPPEMQGKVFLGATQDASRDYVFMARERMDEAPDMQRAVRDSRYLYIRSYEPFRPNGQYLEYLWKAPSMPAWEAYHKAGHTDALTGAFFRPKPVEQLFDSETDPDNVKNLAADPAHAARLGHMRTVLQKQQAVHFDCGFLPEGILLHRVARHKTTIYDFIRDPRLYDQQGYMKAADVANFATPAELPQIVDLLKSGDAGYRYWGVLGCIQLGQQAATPEVLQLMENLIHTEVKDEETLDVRVTAALYLHLVIPGQTAALRSLAEVIVGAPGKSPARGRAWANVNLLGSQARGIEALLKSMELSKKDQEVLSRFASRIH
ncbi:MAG: sulfatase [Lacunisphaera sp.]|nr:sulfatase [Lacunisphaera sp.]